jgi:biotin transport system ATP-binding protein
MTQNLKLEGVTVDFDGYTALAEVSFETQAKSIAVIGENGSGKSTFARLLNGLVQPTAGVITVDGQKPTTKNASLIFSNPDLQIVMPTVFEDVAYTLSDQKLTKDEVRERVNLALAQVDILELANDNCYSLSSGQKQLLAIASAVVRSPKLVIADEPTTLLDLPNTKLITKVLHEMPVVQLVLVTHDLELAATCEEVVWISEGRIKQVGSPAEVVEAYRKYFA